MRRQHCFRVLELLVRRIGSRTSMSDQASCTDLNGGRSCAALSRRACFTPAAHQPLGRDDADDLGDRDRDQRPEDAQELSAD
jgi:hypothetical protein